MVVKGYLREKIELSDQEQCLHGYDFQLKSGGIIEDVTFLDSTIPVNVLLDVHIESNVITKWDFGEAPVEKRWVNKKDIALVRVIDATGERFEERAAVYRRNAESTVRSFEHFFREIHRGKWEDVKVTYYIVSNTTGSGRGLGFNYDHEGIQEQLREQNPEGYDKHNYWHGLGGHMPGVLGIAYLNSDVAWTFTGSLRTMWHEQGHSFGCPHSTTDNNEYGDPACVMAKSYSGMNIVQYGNLGILSQDKIQQNSGNEACFLVPPEVADEDVRNGEHKACLIQSDQGFIAVSTRKTKEQSFLGVAQGNDMFFSKGTVFIHSSGNYYNSLQTKPVYRTRILPNESTTYGGVKITNHGMKDGVVQITTGNATPGEYPQAQPPVPANQIVKAYEGVWHNPDHKYQGIDLHVIPENNQLVGYLFTHVRYKRMNDGEDTHSREWYVLDGTIKDGYAQIDIIKTSSDGSQEVIGDGIMRFTDDGMHFRFFSSVTGRDHMRLVKLTSDKADHKYNGIWSTGELRGYVVSKYSDTFIAYYYSYLDDGRLNWLTYQGSDPSALQGYAPFSLYRANFGDLGEMDETVDLGEITQSATRVL